MSVLRGEIKANGQSSLTREFLDDVTGRSVYEPQVRTESLVVRTGHAEKSRAEPLGTENRYPSVDLVSSRFGTALRLLREAQEHAERALDAAKKGDTLAADDAIYAIKPLLPELFCCRIIGDGFGLIVSSLWAVFQNLAGTAMSAEQLRVVSSCVRTVRESPMITAELADRQIERLEDVGLGPGPGGLEDLVGALAPDE